MTDSNHLRFDLRAYNEAAINARMLQPSPQPKDHHGGAWAEQGVTLDDQYPPPLPFSGVLVLPGLTVLQFSPIEGIPLPDLELPKGSSPDALRTRIDHWRKAAT